MAMMAETRFGRRTREAIKAKYGANAFIHKFHGTQVSAGMPDMMVLRGIQAAERAGLPGAPHTVPYLVEFKWEPRFPRVVDFKKVTALQLQSLLAARNVGAVTAVVTMFESPKCVVVVDPFLVKLLRDGGRGLNGANLSEVWESIDRQDMPLRNMGIVSYGAWLDDPLDCLKSPWTQEAVDVVNRLYAAVR